MSVLETCYNFWERSNWFLWKYVSNSHECITVKHVCLCQIVIKIKIGNNDRFFCPHRTALATIVIKVRWLQWHDCALARVMSVINDAQTNRVCVLSAHSSLLRHISAWIQLIIHIVDTECFITDAHVCWRSSWGSVVFMAYGHQTLQTACS